jgi:hypothetical protein
LIYENSILIPRNRQEQYCRESKYLIVAIDK